MQSEQQDWQTYKPKLTELYNLVLASSQRTILGCIIPQKSNNRAFNIELTEFSYWRLRFQKDEYILTDDGEIRKRQYERKNSKGDVYYPVRKDKVKGTFFLHHLSFYVSDRIPRTEFEVRYSFSHLCGVSQCVNSAHIIYEPHDVNLSRISCCREICVHKTKCIRPAYVIQQKVRATEAKYQSSDDDDDDDDIILSPVF